MNNKVRLGQYQHYKGKYYQVVAIVKHSETLEYLVIYKPLYPSKTKLYARPKKMFLEKVKVEGKSAPRFQFIGSKINKRLTKLVGKGTEISLTHEKNVIKNYLERKI